MKVLFFIPRVYSLIRTLTSGFEQLGIETVIIDFPDFFPHWRNRFIQKTVGLPKRFTKYWQQPYYDRINNEYYEIIKEQQPDFIIIYNDQYFYPETIHKIRMNICPVINYLGDNPYYIWDRPENVATLMEMSYIFAPDSFWIEQIKLLGIENIDFLILGYDNQLNYPMEVMEKERKLYGSDLVVIGRTYRNNWGYKRALFYNQFVDLDLKIYGKGWDLWFDYFPKLRNKYFPIKKWLSFEKVNIIMNSSKIYPIDANPGLLNGLHIRIFDAIGAGILPLVEYRKDLEKVFYNVEIPTIKNYKNAKSLALEYLKNGEKREKIKKQLKKFIDANYTPVIAAKKILKVFEYIR